MIGQAQEEFRIDRFSRSEGTISIHFTDTRPGVQGAAYGLEATGPLTLPFQWTNSSSAVFSSLGGSQYLFTAPEYADATFYRIVAFGTLDTDGDGVPDAVEVALGTNPNVPDWIQRGKESPCGAGGE
ncbi:MAG: thrombospondin type 3 repeat-containing protein [Limisphaerales bacterium]